MTPGAEILGRLEAAGLHLRAEGGSLIAGPREVLTDELRGLIRRHKAELLAVLSLPTAEPTSGEVERDTPTPPETELRSLIEAIARISPYWKPQDVEDAVAIAKTDLGGALTCFRALAERYGIGSFLK